MTGVGAVVDGAAEVMRRIVKLCKKCGGSGNKLVSAKPIAFKPCNKCQGRGGRTSGLRADVEGLLGPSRS